MLHSFVHSFAVGVTARGAIVPSADGFSWSTARRIGLAVGAAGLLAAPLALDLRVKRAVQPLGDGWRSAPIAPRGSTLLGVSFRPPQVEALGLDARSTLESLLAYPIQLIRLGAYWNRIEPAPGAFETSELDWQVDAAEKAGVSIILCVGAVKCFSYPEFFVPAHQLDRPLPEHTLIRPSTQSSLLRTASEFVARIVERYKDRSGVVAWQVEHEAVDPLGAEHSWRLAARFVEKEVDAVRRADPSRPILMNGFFHTSLVGRLGQWWQTRDQGDSIAVALRLADVVGVDYYPRYALAALGRRSLYLDGTKSPWNRQWRQRLFDLARASRRKLMVSEGQAEPWEAVTVPPNPNYEGAYSCRPEQVIDNYNAWMRSSSKSAGLYAYLFWGAEYWLLRARSGDPTYLQAFARVLEQS
jgi:hypothetical protein